MSCGSNNIRDETFVYLIQLKIYTYSFLLLWNKAIVGLA